MGTDDSNKTACLVWLVFLVMAGKVFWRQCGQPANEAAASSEGSGVFETFSCQYPQMVAASFW